MSSKERARLEELAKKRFFYTPSFSIYGGIAGLYDYGPPGTALQANIINLWRSHFVLEEQMLEVDCTVLTPHDVLKTSGHVDRFTDCMTTDVKTGEVFRADHLVEAALEKIISDKNCSAERKAECEFILAQIDGYGVNELEGMIRNFELKSEKGNELGPVKTFNLMFGTDIGPTGYIKGYMRPETAQGQFVNFKKLLEYNNDRMPFASATIGKSFRNEISPRAGLLRVREFLMAEIEHYVHPKRKEHAKFHKVADLVMEFLPASVQQEGKSQVISMTIGQAVKQGIVNNETLGYFLARVHQFLIMIGIKRDKLRFRQHLKTEMSHYASDCWDAEIHSSYGWVECVGNADRACYDLTVHSEKTKEKLVVRERIEPPIQKRVVKVEIDKKNLGMHFKADSKLITEHLESLSESTLETLKTELESGSVTLKIANKEFKLTLDFVKVVISVETVHVNEYIPSVIEPSFGIGRIIYSLLEHVLWTREGDENRLVLSFPPIVAPVKCLILPISHDKSFLPIIEEISDKLKELDVTYQVDDSSASIGKRYSRNDEIGVPFSVTLDFQTVKDRTVTVRERDSTLQIRLSIDEVAFVVQKLSRGKTTWAQVSSQFKTFTQQEI